LLLFAAGHAKQDIPAAIRSAVSQHPGVDWRQAEPLGCHASLLELSAIRFHQSLAETNCDLQRCRLIVVGRGSHDAEATRETVRYAQLLSEQVRIAEVQTGFLAMAEPRLSVVLQEAANSDRETIVVQPHLLFHGELLTEVRQQVQDWSARVPTKKWLMTGHLGPAPQVVAAVVERCIVISR
jgi:sirohydrochlorin cobaltochelatase